jgi:hypothetical protein
MKRQPKESPINTYTLPTLSLSNSRNSFAHGENCKTQKCNTFSHKPHSYPTKLDTTMKTQPKESPINTNTLPILSLSNSRNSVAHGENRKMQKCNMFSLHTTLDNKTIIEHWKQQPYIRYQSCMYLM